MTNFQLSPIENEGKRVLTTAQLAEAYETDSKVISNNFNRNADRYTEGKHFYRLKRGKYMIILLNRTSQKRQPITPLYLHSFSIS